MLSADTAAQLRPSDVDRVLDAANDQGCLQEFREWLLAHPDLMDRTRSNIEQYEVE